MDIRKVIRFYERILHKYKTREILRDRIRMYAKEKVDMAVVMKPVVDYIMEVRSEG